MEADDFANVEYVATALHNQDGEKVAMVEGDVGPVLAKGFDTFEHAKTWAMMMVTECGEVNGTDAIVETFYPLHDGTVMTKYDSPQSPAVVLVIQVHPK